MTTEVLRGSAALTGLDALDALAEQGADLPVPARPRWLRAALGSGTDPVLHVVHRDGRPVAAAALAVTRERGATVARMLGHGACDSARLPALDAVAAQELARSVVAELRASRRWVLELAQLPPQDPVTSALAALTGATTRAGVGCPVAELDPSRPVLDQLSRKGRKAVNLSRNRIETDGHTLEIDWLTGDLLLAQLPALQQLRRLRDHAVGRSSELDTALGTAAHTALVRDHDSAALVLTLDGEVQAYSLGARDGGLLRVWDGRVLPGHERLGLGWVADVELLERVHADPVLHGVDWMRGEQPNKMRSATRVVPAVDLVGFSSQHVERWWDLSQAVAESGRALARRLVAPSARATVRGLLRR